jgi:Vault protein inter-alpha-trypsin domain
MQKHIYLSLLWLLSLTLSPAFLTAQNSLRVQDPRSFRSSFAQIDAASVVIRPKGLFAEVSFFLTYSSKGSFMTNASDTLEVQHFFNLPANVQVIDSWLWIENYIVRAKIIDRWTASTIYNQIVGRRQDPSILLKNGAQSYEFRIFPMAGNQTRTVKLSFLVPFEWQANGQVNLNLPINLMTISPKRPIFHMTLWDDPAWKNPKIVEEPRINFVGQTDSVGKFYTAAVNMENYSSFGSTLRISYDSPMKNGIFVGKYGNNTEGVYQVAFFPEQVANLPNLARKTMVMVDYNSSNTNISATTVLAQIQSHLRQNLTERDSFNLMFSKILNITPLSNQWFSGKATTIDSVFRTLSASSLSNISNLPNLLAKGVEYTKTKGGTLLLVSADASVTSFAAGNELLTEISRIANPLPPIHVLDISNTNHIGTSINGQWYSGNGYFYTNLARQSTGTYADLLYDNDLTRYLPQVFRSINGSYQSFDLYTSVDSGFCHSRFNFNTQPLTLGQPIIQIGRYNGKGDFRLEFAGSYNAGLFSRRLTFNDSQITRTDTTLYTFWSGTQIAAWETSSNRDNATINRIIRQSMNDRVLSLYTAFLALEPRFGGDTCRSCNNDNRGGGQVSTSNPTINDSLKITIAPNPFKTQVTFKMSFPAVKNLQTAQMSAFSTTGQLVKNFDLDLKVGVSQAEVVWQAEGVASGVYLVRMRVDGLQKTVKVVKTE